MGTIKAKKLKNKKMKDLKHPGAKDQCCSGESQRWSEKIKRNTGRKKEARMEMVKERGKQANRARARERERAQLFVCGLWLIQFNCDQLITTGAIVPPQSSSHVKFASGPIINHHYKTKASLIIINHHSSL